MTIEEFSSSDESEDERKERMSVMRAQLRKKWGSSGDDNSEGDVLV